MLKLCFFFQNAPFLKKKMLFENIANNSKKCIFKLEANTAYNLTSSSGADPGSDRYRRRSVIHSELQMLLRELKLKTTNNVTKCLGLGSRDEQ